MPIFQERPIQPEADLYALGRAGDLVIFELKRGFAGSDAMLQALRYGQTAGQWTYDQLETKEPVANLFGTPLITPLKSRQYI